MGQCGSPHFVELKASRCKSSNASFVAKRFKSWGTFVVRSMIKSLWAYRGFILGSVKREFQSQYRNSLLGAAWTVLNPLAMIVVYTVVFSGVMRAKLPGVGTSFAYSIYLCSGILAWGLFVDIVGRSLNVFLVNANILKKICFPRLCLPVALIVNAGINFSIIFGLFTLFLIFSGNFPGWPFIALVPVLAIQIAFAVGLGMSLGILNVFFRDVGQFFGVVLQFWFWLTPITYPVEILPEYARQLIVFNPMMSLIGAFHTIIVNGQWPDWASLWPVSLLALLLCAWAMRLFRNNVGEIVDEL